MTRFDDDHHDRVESAKLLATFLHTLQGTPCIDQGNEIGTTNVGFSSIEDDREVDTLNFCREQVPEQGHSPAETLVMQRAL
ncbi:alpha-amylase family glycosyl hydrolase [Deinococcus taeanensis]|uniref:alpha-amylase family glycosyl hydrolase n=1 Tax=Deinococcus taeanensis TaxID=2737050 RepID=UPI003D81BD8E